MLSMEQPDALNVLLTGRRETGFGPIIQRMVTAKKLDFDLLCLRPVAGPENQKLDSTAEFKLAFLEDLVRTYRQAEEIRVYEDRTKQYDYYFTITIGN